MKRIVCLFVAALIAAGCAFALSGCKEKASAGGENILRICNWEDYISIDEETGKSLADEFEEWYEHTYNVDIEVEYSTFGTNEILYNNLKINPESYDLVCPSDYMIQKMMNENMLEKFNIEKMAEDIPNYYNHVSPYMKNLFDKNGWSEYAVPYMWGTMGYVYNPAEIENATGKNADEVVFSWAAVLNEALKNKTTLKDSVRDTYFMGVALAKLSDLQSKRDAFVKGEITKEAYATYLSETFNDTDEKTVSAVEEKLKEAKKLAFSLEVDEGKGDMVKGNVWLNFAWSGDAVYAMDDAEALGTTLCYSVPEEGSNIWFDGWVMPKGANKKLANAFLNFISDPVNACKNMDFIGYTSAIAGEEVFERLAESDYACDETDEGAIEVDLTYYFGEIGGERAIVYTAEENRQLLAQYPSEDIINRCTVMQYFDDATNERVNAMWNRVKAGNIWLYVGIIGGIVLVAAIAVVIIILAKKGVFEKKVKKGYTRVE